MTNVLILTIAFFVTFVAGIFAGRELTYLADKRKRKTQVSKPPVRKYEPDITYFMHPEPDNKVPPVAGGYIDDESKHWPKTK